MSGGKASDPLNLSRIGTTLGDVAKSAAGMNLATVLGGAVSAIAPTAAILSEGQKQLQKYDNGVERLAGATKKLAAGGAQLQATENAQRPIREALSAIVGQRRQTPGRRQVMAGSGGLLGGNSGGSLLTPRGMS